MSFTSAPPKIQLTRRSLLAILVGVGATAGTYFGFAAPAIASNQKLVQQVAVQTARVASINSQTAVLQHGGATALSKLYSTAKAADRLIPATASLSSLVVTLPAQAQAQGVQITQLTPAATAGVGAPPVAAASAPGLQDVSFSVSASGSYTALTSWLHSVEHNPVLMSVSNVAITSATPGATSGGDTLTCTLNVWYSSTPALP